MCYWAWVCVCVECKWSRPLIHMIFRNGSHHELVLFVRQVQWLPSSLLYHLSQLMLYFSHIGFIWDINSDSVASFMCLFYLMLSLKVFAYRSDIRSWPRLNIDSDLIIIYTTVNTMYIPYHSIFNNCIGFLCHNIYFFLMQCWKWVALRILMRWGSFCFYISVCFATDRKSTRLNSSHL